MQPHGGVKTGLSTFCIECLCASGASHAKGGTDTRCCPPKLAMPVVKLPGISVGEGGTSAGQEAGQSSPFPQENGSPDRSAVIPVLQACLGAGNQEQSDTLLSPFIAISRRTPEGAALPEWGCRSSGALRTRISLGLTDNSPLGERRVRANGH